MGQDDYYIGDFVGLTIANGTAVAAWTDTRKGNQDIFTSEFSLSPAPAAYNDRFEPNETPHTATGLGTVIQEHLPRLAISAGDKDWFELQAGATGNLTVTATADLPGTGLDLELWDATGTTRLATGIDLTGGTGQQVVYPGQSGVTYLVHVAEAMPSSGTGSGGAAGYTLDLRSLTADLGTVAHQVQDDTLATGGQIDDLVTASAAGSLQVQLTPGSGASGNFQVNLLDPTKGTVLASGSPGPGSTIEVGLAVQQAQAVVIQVSGDPATMGAFHLEITNLDQLNSPGVRARSSRTTLDPQRSSWAI